MATTKHFFPTQFPVTAHTQYVGPGSTFVVIRGMNENGVRYIPDAIARGARTIVIERSNKLSVAMQSKIEQSDVQLIHVDNARKALAELSAQAVDYPACKLEIIAITGTKGKTSSCFLLEHALRMCGKRTALLTSAKNKILNDELKTELTTQHPDYLHTFLAECVERGVETVVMEVAAQAVSLHRVHGIEFVGIIFTNFSQEHAEFYDSMEAYFADKKALLAQVKPKGIYCINGDDPWCLSLLSEYPNATTFGFANLDSDILSVFSQRDNYVEFFIENILLKGPLDLIGKFSGYNMLGVIAFLIQYGLKVAELKNIFTSFKGVPGRLEVIERSDGVRFVIDKAHNPSSFQALLSTLQATTSHLVVVFGAGGERDTQKRPLMGSIAAQYCDTVIITSDDPRSENPQLIIADIMQGIPMDKRDSVFFTIDRQKAIRFAHEKALLMRGKKPVVALLGKGSEEYQLIQGVKYRFSEKEIIARLN